MEKKLLIFCMLCLLIITCCSTTVNNKTSKTSINQNIPGAFRGVWSGPSGRYSLDRVFSTINNNPPDIPKEILDEMNKISKEDFERRAASGLVIDMYFVISGNQITQYILNLNDYISDKYIAIYPEKEWFLWSENNFVYVWLNRDEFESEAHIYNFSKSSASRLFCVSTRQTNHSYKNEINQIFNSYYRTPHYSWSSYGNNYINLRYLTKNQIQSMSNKTISRQFRNYNNIINHEFQGTWIGNINKKNDTIDENFEIKFDISNNNINLYVKDDNGTFKILDYNNNYHDDCGKIFIYIVTYNIENRNIIDTYSLTFVNDMEISVIYSSNSSIIGAYDNIIYYLGEGKLIKDY